MLLFALYDIVESGKACSFSSQLKAVFNGTFTALTFIYNAARTL